jgi:hypothetical protein
MIMNNFYILYHIFNLPNNNSAAKRIKYSSFFTKELRYSIFLYYNILIASNIRKKDLKYTQENRLAACNNRIKTKAVTGQRWTVSPSVFAIKEKKL